MGRGSGENVRENSLSRSESRLVQLAETLAAEHFRAAMITPRRSEGRAVSILNTEAGAWQVVELRADDGQVRRNLVEASVEEFEAALKNNVPIEHL